LEAAMGWKEVRRKGGRLALFLVALLVAAWLMRGNEGYSIQRAREAALKQNVFTLRHVIEEYTLDQRKRPQSLEELVTSGYLKQVPADPMTRRYDSWVLEWSKDPKMPGIVDVHSSSHEIGSDGRAYCDW